LALGGARLAYAGSAKALSAMYAARGATLANAMAASAARNGVKQLFRLNPWSTFRVYPFEKMMAKYGGDFAKIIAAAGRTDGALNALGALGYLGGIFEIGTKNGSGCP
jgi:hypothetical protein